MASCKLILLGLLVAMAFVQAKEAPADAGAQKAGDGAKKTDDPKGADDKAGDDDKKKEEDEGPIIYASIESVRIRDLKPLPEVQTFIKEDLGGYRRSKYIKKEDSKTPELVILDKDKKEVERMDIAALNRTQINDLFVAKGMKLHEDENEEDDGDWDGDSYDDDDYYRDEL